MFYGPPAGSNQGCRFELEPQYFHHHGYPLNHPIQSEIRIGEDPITIKPPFEFIDTSRFRPGQ